MRYHTLGVVFTTLLLSTGHTLAADFSFGIGVDVNNGRKIFLPMYIGSLMVEPTINLITTDNKRNSNSNGNEFVDDLEVNDYEFGVGLFKDSTISDTTHVYYGARVGYIDYEANSTKINSTPTSSNESKGTNVSTGYFFTPTIGAQYYVTRQFSLAIDVGFKFWKADGTATVTYTSPIPPDVMNTEDSGHETKAAVIARYQFF